MGQIFSESNLADRCQTKRIRQITENYGIHFGYQICYNANEVFICYWCYLYGIKRAKSYGML